MIWAPPKAQVSRPRCERCGKLRREYVERNRRRLGVLMPAAACCCDSGNCAACSSSLPSTISITGSSIDLARCFCPGTGYDYQEINGGVNDTFSLAQQGSTDPDACEFSDSFASRVQDVECDGSGTTTFDLFWDVTFSDNGGTPRILVEGYIPGEGGHQYVFLGCSDLAQCTGTHTINNTLTACGGWPSGYTGSCSGTSSGSMASENGSVEVTV